MNNAWKLALGLLAATSAADATAQQGTKMAYPETRMVDQVDDYHGQSVKDPYRWLEDDVRESEDVADWVKRQNEVTFGYLKQLPVRERIENRLTKLWDYEKFGSPFKRGGRAIKLRSTSPKPPTARTFSIVVAHMLTKNARTRMLICSFITLKD